MTMPSAAQVVALAKSQVGTKGGSKYWAALGYGSGWYSQPWCAVFVDWALLSCGCALGSAGDYPLNCGNIQTRLVSRAGAAYVDKSQVRAGDVLIYEWDGKGDSYDHVGLALDVPSDGYVRAVEGNDTDTVATRSRSLGYVRAVMRPAYSTTTTTTSSVSSITSAQYTVTVSNGLNVRAKATTSSVVVRALPRGTVVTVTSDRATADGHTWGRLADGTGWVAMEYLSSTIKVSTATASLVPAGTYRVVARNGLNVRSGASTSSAVVTALPYGSTVTLDGTWQTAGGYVWSRIKAGRWVAVRTTGGTEYARRA